MAVGAVVTIISGAIMSWSDESFGFLGLEEAGFNALMMGMVGLLIGAFSQMGFFAYLTLNYIALSVFRKSYLWNTLQGYTTLFAVLGLGYLLYNQRANGWFFWVLPLVLLIASLVIAYVKMKQTNRSAFVPTLFLMFFITFIESWPALQGETNVSAIIFMMVPLFMCNAYQILMLPRLLKNRATDSAISAKPVV